MNVGFIGTGSMGSILIESLIHTGALRPDEIIASNRTSGKIDHLTEHFIGLRKASTNIEVVQHCEIIFLCIKPSDFKAVINEIKPFVQASQIVISITSPITIAYLEDQLSSKIAKIIPSITNYVLSGSTLCIYGERLLKEDMVHLEHLLKHISEPIRVAEQFTRISSDISSCGPAFFALILLKFIRAAVEETGFNYADANLLACEMLLGTGKLLTSGGFTPGELQKRVAVPGGITAEGLKLLDQKLDGVFNQLFQITHAKFIEDMTKVNH
ncbi:MAG: late competence protein ComER [Paenibacillaceae bacterium]